MNNDLLFSMQGSVLLGVDTSVSIESLTLLDLVRAKKHAASGEPNSKYDYNNNGTVDNDDIEELANALLSI